MPQNKKRETAYKMRIGEILKGNPIIEYESVSEGGATRERFKFLEIGTKQIQRVNMVANIIDRYSSDSEKKFATLTIDDGTGQMRVKVFGDDIEKVKDFGQGETIIIIGLLRSYNNEVYILPEIIKKADPRYLLIRKIEIEKEGSFFKEEKSIFLENKQEKISTKEKIVELIRKSEGNGGIETEEIILVLKDTAPELINKELIKLIEEGTVYEPRPGKVRYLG